jgi:hypothetical protein
MLKTRARTALKQAFGVKPGDGGAEHRAKVRVNANADGGAKQKKNGDASASAFVSCAALARSAHRCACR